ncbi:MAG: HD domain-containing protein, partial [Candidatus Hydrogenedentes bacterium]|nr:HD domain-containing protein [Candidatus Hydrogenedentota bacterium]
DSPHSSVVLIRDEQTGQLVAKHMDTVSGGPLTVNGPLMDRAMKNAEAIVARLKPHESTHFGVAADAVCVPLIHRGDTLGVLYIEANPPTETFTSDKLELVTALAGPIAIAVKHGQVLERLEQSYEQTLFGLASAIELRDHYTVGHTLRVTQFALAMARELGWPEEKLKQCERGGILHDIGKIAVDDAILRKAGPLTEEERKKVRVHPERGARILQDIKFLADVIPYVLYHHERYDGRTDGPDPGYPYGLAGEDIPIEGRLMGVADAFDALTSNRPYKRASEPEEAIAILRDDRGTRLDPVCVRALTRCFLAGRIHPILQDYRKADEKSIACPFCSTFIRIPERAEQGIEWDCGICHRRIRLLQHGNAWRGELVSGASLGGQHPLA